MEIGIEEDETLQQTALRRKLGFFGHFMRSDGLEKERMLAHGDGRRRRGQPRRKWMDEIQEVTGMKLAELRDVATERKIWRKIVKTIARTQRVDSTSQLSSFLFCSCVIGFLSCLFFTTKVSAPFRSTLSSSP